MCNDLCAHCEPCEAPGNNWTQPWQRADWHEDGHPTETRLAEWPNQPPLVIYPLLEMAVERAREGFGRLQLYPKYGGAYRGWYLEGHYKSDGYGNGYTERQGGQFLSFYGKPTRG